MIFKLHMLSYPLLLLGKKQAHVTIPLEAQVTIYVIIYYILMNVATTPVDCCNRPLLWGQLQHMTVYSCINCTYVIISTHVTAVWVDN